MNFDSLSQYKINILYKHARHSTETTNVRRIALAYNTSKFNSPISLLLVFITLSLISVSTSPYITQISQLCYMSNAYSIFFMPFLTESLLVL